MSDWPDALCFRSESGKKSPQGDWSEFLSMFREFSGSLRKLGQVGAIQKR